MRLGFIGLGRMGSNMVLNLMDKKHEVVVFNRSREPIEEMEKKGAIGSYSLDEFFRKLGKDRIIWIMIKAGQPIDEMIGKLMPYLKKDDVLVDGGNSYFEDSIRRAGGLKKKGVYFLDCGTSGGMNGARYGACMMIGGEKSVFLKIETLFRDMCVKNGYGYMGGSGAGHFVKMVHNGIEYGMMGALAEGMEAVNKMDKFKTDLKEVAKVYANGSIIEGKLSKWLYDAFNKKGYLDEIAGEVPKGETEEEMEKLEKLGNMVILKEAIKMRIKTREKADFKGKMIAALRNQFGGHEIIKEG